MLVGLALTATAPGKVGMLQFWRVGHSMQFHARWLNVAIVLVAWPCRFGAVASELISFYRIRTKGSRSVMGI
jgi:hypothetical protein